MQAAAVAAVVNEVVKARFQLDYLKNEEFIHIEH